MEDQLNGSKIKNPWKQLPSRPPYVLDCDKDIISEFNSRATRRHFLRLDVMPEPFIGLPNAKIVLLNLNPGFKKDDVLFHQKDEYFIASSKRNLKHEIAEYPFHLLDPKNRKSPGFNWWSMHLKHLVSIVGLPKVSNSVFCIELFPYHSVRYKSLGKLLPSQKYSFQLVIDAIKRNAIIIIMRAKKKWLENVPELSDYKCFTLSSSQNVCISPGNLSEFKIVVESLAR